MSKDQHLYPIRYTVQFGDFLKEDIADDQGLTHSLIIVSCIEQHDGSYSQTWHTYDGKTQKSMKHDDVFKAWILMAPSLAIKDDLSPIKRDFVRTVFETFRQAFFAKKG